MIKCAKKFVNQLTRGKYAGKVDPSRWQSFGVVRARVLRHFSVFPRMYTPIFPMNYKTFSMWLQNKDKTETYNALCNFSESPHMCRSSNHMAWCIMRLVYFALYKWLAVCACEWVWLIRLFMRSWLVWALRAWERWRVWRFCVFVIVDVKYIIHYRRICKFICSL